jgi:pyridoxal 5'-phosphate synthase pdxT subunit
VKIGLLALQGAVEPHARSLARLGVAAVPVRRNDHLADVDALVIPGGESTTISMLLERQGMVEPLSERLAGGMPALGTCAGMILLAADVADGRVDQHRFGAIDIGVRRNGYGRQVDSFESDLVLASDPAPFHAVFIRAPLVERVGDEVEVLARVDGVPVLCRQGNIIVSSFHPELSDDTRIHQLLVDAVGRTSTTER